MSSYISDDFDRADPGALTGGETGGAWTSGGANFALQPGKEPNWLKAGGGPLDGLQMLFDTDNETIMLRLTKPGKRYHLTFSKAEDGTLSIDTEESLWRISPSQPEITHPNG